MKHLFFSPFFLAMIAIWCGGILCSGCYTLKQGTTMLGYLNRAIPLEDLAAESADTENRYFAGQVMNIRKFAMEELGLKESKNYTTYVELNRDYLAAVVSACARDSFTRHEWWFPVVGKVPYKGFFDIQDARREREKLEQKDLDVWIRGVDAFSTLGWLRDPLYSYMKNYSPRELAELIIHELLHATIYLKNHSQFNEELAEFVGTEGARLYMEYAASPAPELMAAKDETAAQTDSAVFLGFIQDLIMELDKIYQDENLTREEKLRRKGEMISQFQTSFMETYDQMFKTENYRNFGSMQINNAYLELYRLYYERNSWFKDLYEKTGSDLRVYISAAKTLRGRDDPRMEFEKALGL